MASQNVIQTSFNSGELSPNLFAHVDMEQYHSGAARMRNFFVDYRSGASNRAGTAFVIQTFSQLAVRLIPFQASILTPYVLEFGDNYMRPISLGAPVLAGTHLVTSVSLGSGTTITATGAGADVAIGDWIFVSGLEGTIELNGRYFIVSNVIGDNLTLSSTYGGPINSTNYTPYTIGGQINRVYKISSPYHANDLQLLKFVQITNTMYITHPSYPPQKLVFSGPTSWAFSAVSFGATIGTPSAPTVTTSSAGTATFSYEVTAVDSAGQESTPSSPGAVTSSVNIAATAGTITISWPAVGGAIGYNVYKAENGLDGVAVPAGAVYGFATSTSGTSVIDSNIVPDFTRTPQTVLNPFAGGNDPGCCCFFQQRLYYAGSNSLPQTFWASQPGFYDNFNLSDPIQADDSITGTLVSLQVNFIKAMVPMPGGLILLTSGGAWQLSSGAGGLASTATVTPINATATPQAYNGISDVPPIVINQDVLYVQYKNSIVRDLEYNIYANIYTGADVSVLSNHLFFGYQIMYWAYAEEPFKVIWCVRNDGQVLSFSYLKEQKLMGWAHHDTLGSFTSVATVTEPVGSGHMDATYFTVRRSIQGALWQFVERMDNRIFTYGAEDAWFVDCGSQSAIGPGPGDLTISASTGTATFTSNSSAFNPAIMVGWVIRAGGGIATITHVTSTTVAIAQITQAITAVVPDDPNNTPLPAPFGSWSLTQPATVFHGLDYLEGQTVSILADGNVQNQQVVTNGAITLQVAATKVTVGLAFTAQLQTMPLDLGDQKDTIQGKRKKLSALTVRLSQTRGLSYGQTFNNLTPIKEFSQGQVLGSTISLVTGDERVIMDPLWDVPGQICLQQDNPLPATVLGVIPEITVGDTVK